MVLSHPPLEFTRRRREKGGRGVKMRKLRNLFAAVFAFFLIILGFTRRAKAKAFEGKYITCIYFHNPGRKLFARCIRWLLKNNYTFISSTQLADILAGRVPLPAGAVWVSFDDGWKGNVENVIPVLKQYNVPATFFVSTGPIEGDGIFWWTLAEKNRNHLPLKYRENIDLLWQIAESERKTALSELPKGMDGTISRESMTVDDVKYISAASQVTIGSHTINHVITVNCTPTELELEIAGSKEKLESWTGKTVNTFAYPNGDLDGREAECLKKNNYILAAAAGNKLASSEDNVYNIPRLSVDDGFFIEELCHMLGVWQQVVSKLKSIFL